MTNTAKHTPGPWHKGIGTLEITHKGDKEVIAYVAVRSKGLAGSVEGNMNLIAAAPVMYEALEHAAMSCHHPACKCKGEYASQPERYCTCHVQKARQALAQAEGRQT